MEELANFYKKNKNINPLFSTHAIFDWYAGAVSGIANLNNTNDFYLFNIVAWDIVSQLRIFNVVYIAPDWLDKFKDAINQSDSNLIIELMENYFRQYSKDVFLLKSKHIDALEYDLIKHKTSSLKPYKGIEKIANQSAKVKQKWFNLFLA